MKANNEYYYTKRINYIRNSLTVVEEKCNINVSRIHYVKVKEEVSSFF
jgi:hypothetical protein